MNSPLTKQQYRVLALEQRAALSPADQANATERVWAALTEYLEAEFGHRSSLKVMIYLAIPQSGEINLLPWAEQLAASHPDWTFCVPYLERGKPDMTTAAFHPQEPDLTTGPFRVPQPAHYHAIDPQSIDVVITPTLVVDNLGNRVGYGKGYYDRFLTTNRPDVLTIGVGYWSAVPPISDVDAWDYPLGVYVDGGMELATPKYI